jgi:ERCC4-type nuclease
MTTATKPPRRARSSLPAELRPEQVTAIVDTREQLPLDLAPLRAEAGSLVTGDYSVRGLETVVAIERKSLPDLLGCIGQDRERFDREVVRLLAYPCRAIVIEATWGDLEAGQWRSQVSPSAAVGSVLGWIAAGLPVIMAGDHARAGRYVGRLLFTAARRRWREARALVMPIIGENHKPTSAAAADGAETHNGGNRSLNDDYRST